MQYLISILVALLTVTVGTKKIKRSPIIPHNVNPSQKIDGTWAIRNINSVQKRDNINLIDKLQQNYFINNKKTVKVRNFFVFDNEEFSIYTQGRLLPGKQLLKLNLDKDCDHAFAR